ncbi:hypothetical protein NQZ79_g5076 [Umbelopsis isabellina]|nr:hypothetical protein NQZ79_g5076 [Umbelopsis isabellina]
MVHAFRKQDIATNFLATNSMRIAQCALKRPYGRHSQHRAGYGSTVSGACCYALACTSFTALVLAAPLTLIKRETSGVQTQCKKGYFALTFDDGPYMYTEELVDLLDEKNVKIASHTWSHADLDSLSESGIQKEMEQLEDALMRVIGVKPAFMRPPYGNSNEKTTQVLNDLGYTVVTWNVDTKDYETHDLTQEMDNYKTELPPSDSGEGGIALEHDVYKQTVEELAASAIKYIEEQGYKFSTVADYKGHHFTGTAKRKRMLYLRYSSFVIAVTAAFVTGFPVSEHYERYFPAGVKTTCNEGHFALTFDDGPFMYTNELLDKLEKEDIKVTFFVNGKNYWDIQSMPEAQYTIRRAYAAGHQIASHTYSHANLSTLDIEGVKREVQSLEQVLLPIIGKKPAFIRPPFGAMTDVNFDLLTGLGYTVVRWSVDSKGYETQNLEKEIANYKAQVGPSNGVVGGIALEHDVYQQTVEELIDFTIAYVKSRGYKFVTVAECFNANPYQ